MYMRLWGDSSLLARVVTSKYLSGGGVLCPPPPWIRDVRHETNKNLIPKNSELWNRYIYPMALAICCVACNWLYVTCFLRIIYNVPVMKANITAYYYICTFPKFCRFTFDKFIKGLYHDMVVQLLLLPWGLVVLLLIPAINNLIYILCHIKKSMHTIQNF